MAAGSDEDVCTVLQQEFKTWQENTGNDYIFLLETGRAPDDSGWLSMLLGSEHRFKLHCPLGYPEQTEKEHFYVEAGTAVNLWANTLNEFLLDTAGRLSLTKVLDKAASLYTHGERNCIQRRSEDHSEDDISMETDEDEEESAMVTGLSDDDSAFTTEWELNVARKKKRWAQKEHEIREELKTSKVIPGTSDIAAIQAASGQERQHAKQIFTSSAASGILTNDLVKIMECAKDVGFTADPVDDNIYHWCVRLYDFQKHSELSKDLAQINSRFGYDYIELQLDFAIDLYPFYPPLVKVIRPRLEGSMMQRVTNMEMLKLSYWNPAKDMCSVLKDIKSFLQQWARLDVNSERNDTKLYPFGSYVDIEHHLLRLALVSEVSPRANFCYHLEVERPPERKAPSTPQSSKKKSEEYWAAGTGYGHNKRPEWDIKAYLAAQKLKDKQVVCVLRQILHELKKLYAQHAPQLKPRNMHRQLSPPPHSVDPVQDMYDILEGSALIPFLEQYLVADSFLEICRHTDVYKVIIDIIREIAMQPQLVALIGGLPNQSKSLHLLISLLDQKASTLLMHICKVGNGSVPKPLKKGCMVGKKSKEKGSKTSSPSSSPEDKANSVQEMHLPSVLVSAAGASERTAEEKLAREFQALFKDVSEAFARAGISPGRASSPDQANTEAEVTEISISTNETAELEARYKLALKDLLLGADDLKLEGSGSHCFTSEYKKQSTPGQSQVFRIAQEVTSLATSLPINLSSSIFVRTDDEKLTLMRALICGPEGTPYSAGCFVFDIFFPTGYPKVPPMVNLQTTGGGTVRFNPNLYNCGKVCLSLLGTWEGQQGEQWNDTTSTILQVLVSIQSLILVPDPYFNEPGYEQEIGTEAGKRHSLEYNLDVLINNIKYAMIAQMQNPTSGFEDVIKTHFYLKRDRLLQEVRGWVERTKNSKLERAYQNLRQELYKLQPPPNCINICHGRSPMVPRSPQI
ncbi:hypothetical protein NP493_516g01000 [Ridgeia piscesae]|uniref:UBC core domain-containing protein n=1 Tax=Ridgeia piscesae TaxID=27915 RepID=A0AAD9KX59_RIDPI|nr:hypothetical protein NP493_516g01000 [Ridgeia piscesae]